jgi:small ligand-binding sensory domain FIST
LVLVSCTAKGRQMYKEEGVEAQLVHAVSGQLPFAGVYCDGEIGAPVPTSKAAVQFCGARRQASGVSKLMGFTTIATMLAAAHS